MSAPHQPARRPLRPLHSALLTLAAGLAAACGDSPVPQPRDTALLEPTRPPHVLLIVMDTTRGDRCSVLGYGRPTTPGLESLAAESILFTNAWVPGGWTAPVHASLFTGTRAGKHGLRGDGAASLRQGAVTMAELLRDAGYRTSCLSDNPVVSPSFALIQGFTDAPPLYRDRDRGLPRARDTHRRALERLRQAHEAGERAFVYVNDFEPHLPYAPGEEFQRAFLTTEFGPSTITAAREWSTPTSVETSLGLHTPSTALLACLPDLYDAEIATVDAEIHALVEQLRAEGLLDETLVIVTSDHGENLGDRGWWDHKLSLHRSIRHVPLLVRLPEGAHAGRVVDDVVRIEDVLPTVLEVCALPAPPDLDGRSLVSDTRGRTSRASWAPHMHMYKGLRQRYPQLSDTLFKASFRAAFDGRYHLIARSDGVVELYDHRSDPSETVNIAADAPDVVSRMTGLLDPW